MRLRRCVVAVLLILGSREVMACGHPYSGSMFYHGRDAMKMPNAMFDIECRRILGISEPWEFAGEHVSPRVDLHKKTVEADLREFAEAVRDDPESDRMIADYTAARSALSRPALRWLGSLQQRYYSFQRVPEPEPFDFAPYEEKLASLPAEFERYFRGAVAHFNQNWDEAEVHFASVLELPAEQRTYRSTWAAFMLGKTWLQKDPAQAIPFFEQTRALAAEGFRDALDLAEASVGWQAQAEMKSGAYVAAMHRYAELAEEASPSLRVVCRRALDEEQIDPALVRDELSRRIITAWLVAHSREKDKARKWLDALQSVQWTGVVPGADHMVWRSYQNGDMADAEEWLAHCEPDAPYAQWVRAMLLLRAGSIEAGTALLQQLSDSFPYGDAWRVQSPDPRDYTWYPVMARSVVRADLGHVLFKQGDYRGALLAFLRVGGRGGSWLDARFLAERVMTPEELQEFVETQAENPELIDEDSNTSYYSDPGWRIKELRHVLARRWARMGMWDKALPYYPDRETRRSWLRSSKSIPEVAKRAKAHADAAHDETLEPRARAEHLIELGYHIREYGPDLYNPDLSPSTPIIGRFRSPDYPADLQQRLDESLEHYPRMNYFVWAAADMMWQAAELLPDNDVLTARALFLGGVYLKNRDPIRADQFYKALVRRNPNLLIARQADELRWFPNEFTDVVLYQPRPERSWYDRKRNVALAVLLPLGAVGLTLVAIYSIRRAFARGTAVDRNQDQA